jgi:glutaryl-CoA dehydrogenase
MTSKLYNPPDYYLVDELLSEEHKIIRHAVRDWVDRAVKPIIEEANQNHLFPRHLLKELGELGAFGSFLPHEYGGAGMDQIAYGLIMTELERGDSGIRSAASVQSSLVMYPIYTFGSEEQRRKYLPRLAKGELVGAFGLTESDHGSDPSNLRTHLALRDDHYRLNGSKMWITNASICDVAIVWARDEHDILRGVIVERGMEGFTTPETTGKWSLRASVTGELVFEDVMIPAKNILPDAEGLKSALLCLNSARYGIAWGVIGVAMECYDIALRYALERFQFNRPIAAFQLTQKKFAEMLTEITKAQLLVWRLGVLRNENKATHAQISMAKRNNVKMALDVAHEARQILGAMGITSDFPIMRHMMNLESVLTYEGTHDIHLLITGEDITGIDAFH